MQQTLATVSLLVFFIPMIALCTFRYLTIGAYKKEEQSPTTWIARLGKKLAHGESYPFTFIYSAFIIFYSFVLFYCGLSFYGLLLNVGPDIFEHIIVIIPLSGIIFLPLLLMGLLYVTMTERGLSWWYAFNICFRFDSFHGRLSYLQPVLEELVEEAQEGLDAPHRAFLTLQRLFIHRFEVGRMTRKLLREMDSQLYHDFEAMLLEEPRRLQMSRVLFKLGLAIIFFDLFCITLGVLLILFDIVIYISFLILFDILTSLSVVVVQSGIIVHSLELSRCDLHEYRSKVLSESISEESYMVE